MKGWQQDLRLSAADRMKKGGNSSPREALVGGPEMQAIQRQRARAILRAAGTTTASVDELENVYTSQLPHTDTVQTNSCRKQHDKNEKTN